MNKSSSPRRKRLQRKNRLASAKKWIPSYSGKNIVKGYANWYGVDLLCSIKELRMNGVIIDEGYEIQVIKSMESKISNQRKNDKNPSKLNSSNESEFSDQNFDFIAGYTSGGAPFGMTNVENLDYENEKLSDKQLNIK